MELLAGLLASMKLMKGVGGRRSEEPQGPVTQAGSHRQEELLETKAGRTLCPSGSQGSGKHQDCGFCGRLEPMRREQELGFPPAKGAQQGDKGGTSPLSNWRGDAGVRCAQVPSRQRQSPVTCFLCFQHEPSRYSSCSQGGNYFLLRFLPQAPPHSPGPSH